MLNINSFFNSFSNFFSKSVFKSFSKLFSRRSKYQLVKNQEPALTREEQLKIKYHELTKQINNLQSRIDNTADELMIDALQDGITMYSKLRASIYFELKNV